MEFIVFMFVFSLGHTLHQRRLVITEPINANNNKKNVAKRTKADATD